MNIILQLHIPSLPILDQKNVFLATFLRKNLLNTNVIVETSPNIVHMQVNCDNNKDEFLKILKIGLKSSGWSTNMYWNSYKVMCSRPIERMFIKYNNTVLHGEILGITLISTQYEFYTLDYRKNLICEQLQHMFQIQDNDFVEKNLGIFENPIVMPVTIEHFGLDKKLIDFILREHFFSMLHNNKALCVFEKDSQINLSLIGRNINARIKDYKLLIDLDLKTSLTEYIERNNNKILNRHIGTIMDERQGVVNILQVITNHNFSESLKNFIEYYRIGLCSNTVQEDHQLEQYMNIAILKHNKLSTNITNQEQDLIDLSKNIFTLNKLLENNKTFTSKKDPFGFRKYIKNIIYTIQKYNLFLSDHVFCKCLPVLSHKCPLNPLFKNLSLCEKIYVQQYEHIFLQLYKRVKNLAEQIEPVNQWENKYTLKEIENVKLNTLIDCYQIFHQYIHNNKIINNTEGSINLLNMLKKLDYIFKINKCNSQ